MHARFQSFFHDLNWSPAIQAIQKFYKPGSCFKQNIHWQDESYALVEHHKMWNPFPLESFTGHLLFFSGGRVSSSETVKILLV